MLTLPEIKEGNGPILMLNMVRFKDRRLYFEEYLPAFYQVVEKLGLSGAKVIMTNDVIANLVVTDGEAWDAIVLVEYPSVAAFATMAQSKEYHEIAEPLRLAALSDIRLFMTRSIAY
ncbi:DUF1330 domain-containing protein [Chitinophaga rhizophila]|uniref:DUF1330 domain-containing protein n=1 Tax=Chitinophaga rhizophila TaxID=2866212 RepID=A0ABS7GA05_9BACT|nr:DUF1330 domain-containing protein [Chitinophaga rhizophila]MBW8684492.1 DUF1330 domain-containing protein [Chitinophaga rhizophila]